MKIVHFNQLCRTIPYSWNFDPYIIFFILYLMRSFNQIFFFIIDTTYLEYTPLVMDHLKSPTQL